MVKRGAVINRAWGNLDPRKVRAVLAELGVTRITRADAIAVAQRFGHSIAESSKSIKSWVSYLVGVIKNGEENNVYRPLTVKKKFVPSRAPKTRTLLKRSPKKPERFNSVWSTSIQNKFALKDPRNRNNGRYKINNTQKPETLRRLSAMNPKRLHGASIPTPSPAKVNEV